MNVYFCDVCGVRVTDVDLHAGHGMRRRNDVICAACIDLGHGKEWVEAHAQKKVPAMAGAAAHGAQGPNGSNGHDSAPPRPVELARDRLRTLDEDEPASPVKPLPVAAQAAPEFDDTAQVPVVNQELASAAAGFAALTPPKVEKSETDEDDIEELPAPKLDDSGMSPKLDDSGSSPAVAASSPFADAGLKIVDRAADGDADEDGDGQKSETAVSEKSIDDSDRPESKKGPSARKATSSSRVSKSSKTGRAKRGPKKNSQQQFMLISIASMALIVIIGIIVIASRSGPSHTGGEKIPVNISTALRESVAKAKSEAKSAVGSHDINKLNSAHAAVMDVRSAVSAYERVAREKGFTDDMIENGVAGYGVMDVYSVDRAIRDEIEVVHAQGQH